MVALYTPGTPNYSNNDLNDLREKGETLLFCNKCNTFSVKTNEKSKKVVHCKQCGICVEGNNNLFNHILCFTIRL